MWRKSKCGIRLSKRDVAISNGSYGGISLIITLMSIGLLINIAKR